jgi:hypothetical protein
MPLCEYEILQGGILRVSSSRVLTCRCGFRQVWLSLSPTSCCVGLGLSRVIGDPMFCTAVDASMTLASCDGVRTVIHTVWLA